MDGERIREPVETDLYVEIQRFLADEAALLDRHAYREWFSFVTTDISYRITTHVVRPADEGTQHHEIIDENHELLGLRVEQLSDPKLTRAENPRSLYRRFVTNVCADHGDYPDSFFVATNLLVYKNRPSNQDVQIYAGERRDVLRRVDRTFHIASRVVRLDQTVLLGGALGTVF
jgi:3-phenylpropionate/cinnamic acid dioxygenase small subunit